MRSLDLDNPLTKPRPKTEALIGGIPVVHADDFLKRVSNGSDRSGLLSEMPQNLMRNTSSGAAALKFGEFAAFASANARPSAKFHEKYYLLQTYVKSGVRCVPQIGFRGIVVRS